MSGRAVIPGFIRVIRQGSPAKFPFEKVKGLTCTEATGVSYFYVSGRFPGIYTRRQTNSSCSPESISE